MVGALTLDRVAPWAGMAGSAVIGVCALIAAVGYRGTAGEPFSPFNHYVSELGELGVSRFAVVFNAGLVVGGIAFALFMVGLGRVRGALGGSAYGAIGMVSGLAGAAVGIFPLNSLATHTIAAFFFFNLGWISVALASVDALVRPDPRFPVRTAAVGFATVGAFVAFVWSYALSGSRTNGLAPSDVRPTFDIITVFEWLAIVGIIAWAFLVGWDWSRSHAADPA